MAISNLDTDVDQKKYNEGYEKTFGKKKENEPKRRTPSKSERSKRNKNP